MEVIRAKHNSKVDGGEVYSPPRVVTEAVAAGTRKGFSVDLTAKRPSGRVWDFSQRSCQREALALINETRPLFVIGSHPCTPCSTLQNLSSTIAAGRKRIAEGKERGRVHLDFCAKIYDICVEPAGILYMNIPRALAHGRRARLATLLRTTKSSRQMRACVPLA